MKNYIAFFAMTLPLLITACGKNDSSSGEGVPVVEANPPPITQTNQPPIAQAGANRSVFEQGSMTLDARRSTDADDDSLSYHWVQLSGQEVALSNENSPQSSFVAPTVDADTELVFELEVMDEGKATSTDMVTITIKKQLSSLDQQLNVHPVSSVINAEPGQRVDIAYQYKAPEGDVSVTGLMVKLHWNSSQLSFKEMGEVLAVNHLGVSPEMLDLRDDDHNADTDKYVILSWLDYEGIKWLRDASLPAALFSASFEPVVGATGSTQVNVSPHFTSPGYILRSQTVSVEM